MKFGGIDPGKNGALAIIDEDGTVLDILMIPKIGKTEEVDKRELVNLFADLTAKYKGELKHIVMENVHAIHGSAATSTFTFGGLVWSEEILLIVCEIPYTLVTPKDWQKEMWQGIVPLRKAGKKCEKTGVIKKGPILTKETSLIAIKRLFPKLILTDPTKPKARVPHDGIVDAVLLAEYGRRKFS